MLIKFWKRLTLSFLFFFNSTKLLLWYNILPQYKYPQIRRIRKYIKIIFLYQWIFLCMRKSLSIKFVFLNCKIKKVLVNIFLLTSLGDYKHKYFLVQPYAKNIHFFSHPLFKKSRLYKPLYCSWTPVPVSVTILHLYQM